ncbi:MAG: amidohydrolase family protein [Nitrososphaeria archaeon]|nr:amidohydrolase family protein [Nitrososphaeria archaeon]NIN53568.1 amidohydrolase family protein [Nitrososphaeria archaeon]NIQ34088.1 amidohydrolase family protein [Nitrososphaeria archaeon]
MEGPVKAIKAGKLIDGTGNPPIENAVVVVKGSRIEAVGEEVKVPSHAQVIDADGKNVMPGLLDIHVHLASVEAPGSQVILSMVRAPPSLLILYAAKHARDMLEAGYTTVRDLGILLSTVPSREATPLLSLRGAIELGLVPGPRVVVAGPIYMTAGHYDMIKPPTILRSSGETADGAWEVRRKVRELIRENVDLIKTSAGGGAAGEAEEIWWRNYTVEELEAIVDEAHAQGRKVAAHVYTPATIKNALEAGVDTIEHGSFLDDQVIDMMVKKETVLVPTLTVFSERNVSADPDRPVYYLRKMGDILEASKNSFQKAHRAGVKIAAGTDLWAQWPPAPIFGENAYELELMVKYGMSEMEAIVASTKTAAEALGLEDQIGTLEKGKEADIIISESDPLKNIEVLQDKENIQMVMKGGKIAVNRGMIPIK